MALARSSLITAPNANAPDPTVHGLIGRSTPLPTPLVPMHATPSRRSARSLPASASPRHSSSTTGEPGISAEVETKTRVTQLDIARAAGVHNTTVSLALRNSPSIPVATRRRIQALAEKLGYCPDPALRALVAYRNGLATNRRIETLAYVTHGETKWSWRENPIEEQYFLSAQRKAAASGYNLEHFWLGEPGMNDRRLSSMLFHRGITGVLLAAHTTGRTEPLEFDWDRFSAVKLGHLPHAPALHRVTNDAIGNIRLAIRRILGAGYRRVGLVLPKPWDEALDQGWTAGFVAEQNRMPEAQRIPILFHQLPRLAARDGDRRLGYATETAKLAHWLNEFQPDALLGSFPLVSGMLSELGVETARDIAFVDLLHEGSDPSVAGVHPNCHRVGEVAVEILIGHLQQNLRGLPSIPTTTLVSGVWCDGLSLPPCHVSNWAGETPAMEGGNLKHAETAA